MLFYKTELGTYGPLFYPLYGRIWSSYTQYLFILSTNYDNYFNSQFNTTSLHYLSKYYILKTTSCARRIRVSGVRQLFWRVRSDVANVVS
jgi:hypothetical protein